MAFGIGKSRESWSSRPLSMILPDNVKLFHKKNRNVMERATQDQLSRRALEDAPAANATSRRASRQSVILDAVRRDSRSGRPSDDFSAPPAPSPAPKPANPRTAEPSPLGARSRAPVADEQISESSIPTVDESAPFLTLQLDDNRHSLLGLSEQYLSEAADNKETVARDSSVNPDSVSTDGASTARAEPSTGSSLDTSPVVASRASSEKEDSGKLAHLSTPDVESLSLKPASPSPPAASSPAGSLSTDKADTTADTEELGEIPWSVKPRDTPVLFQLDQPFLAPDLDMASRDESTASAPASLTTIDEKIVAPNRKVVFNRGVYIFDPADGDELTGLSLTEDDLFNPFEA